MVDGTGTPFISVLGGTGGSFGPPVNRETQLARVLNQMGIDDSRI